MANNLSNYAENALMDWLMGGSTPSRPSARYVALHTADPTEAGNVGELSGNGYARQAATFDVAVAGVTQNGDNPISFGPCTTANWGTVTHLSIWDAPSAGNCLWQGPLAASKTVNVGESLQIPLNGLTVALD